MQTEVSRLFSLKEGPRIFTEEDQIEKLSRILLINTQLQKQIGLAFLSNERGIGNLSDLHLLS